MKVMQGETATTTIDFRDWKYLSDITRFKTVTDNAKVIAGLEEGSIEIDFNKMTENDK
jgi:hypothetical protein